MRGEMENWKNGWYGVTLGLSAAEIDRMIGLFARLGDDPDQHFHVSSDYSGSRGLGDIEVYVSEEDWRCDKAAAHGCASNFATC